MTFPVILGLPLNYWLALAGVAVAALWMFSPALTAAVKAIMPGRKPDTGGDTRRALDMALALKAHFKTDSLGRAAMKPVIEALIGELTS